MIIISFLICLILILLIHYNQVKKYGPPGPFSYPIIGSLHLISDGQPQNGLHKLYLKYGKIFSLWLGSVYTVVLCEPDVIYEALTKQANIFSDRYMSLSMYIVGDSNNIGFTNGEHWKKLRSVVTKALTKSKSRKLENLMIRQFENMSNALKEQVGTGPIDIRPYLKLLSFNIILSFLFSKEVSFNTLTNEEPSESEKDVKELLYCSDRLTSLMAAGNPSDYIKFLKIFNNFSELEDVSNRIVRFASKMVKEHFVTIDRLNPRDFIDQLIIEFEADQQTDKILDYSCLERICIDMIVGGGDTGSTSLEWLVLLLANNPEYQEKIYQELNNQEMVVEYTNKNDYPMTNSLIKEGFRYRPTAPLGLPHKCTQDTYVGDYFIPKDSQVIINIFSASLSDKIWENPLVFNPFRFLDGNISSKLSQPLVWGEGSRKCPGANLAEVEAFILTGNLFKNFKFIRPSEDKLIDETPKMGVTLEPTPFKIKIELR